MFEHTGRGIDARSCLKLPQQGAIAGVDCREATIIATNVSLVALHAGEYDRAIEEAQKGVDLNPLSTVVQVMLARAYTEKGMHEEAVAVAERMVKIDGTDPRALGTLAGTYARAGRRTDALRILGALPVDRFEPRDLAAVHAALGDADAAFAWLEKAYDDRTIWVVFLDVDPAFDPLRSDPRFQALLRRVGLPEN